MSKAEHDCNAQEPCRGCADNCEPMNAEPCAGCAHGGLADYRATHPCLWRSEAARSLSAAEAGTQRRLAQTGQVDAAPGVPQKTPEEVGSAVALREEGAKLCSCGACIRHCNNDLYGAGIVCSPDYCPDCGDEVGQPGERAALQARVRELEARIANALGVCDAASPAFAVPGWWPEAPEHAEARRRLRIIHEALVGKPKEASGGE